MNLRAGGPEQAGRRGRYSSTRRELAMTHSNPHKHHGRTKGKQRPPAFENQGEGDEKSAGRYNEDLQRSVKKSSYEHKAREAARALDHEGPELRKAEDAGKARAKEEDPALERDHKKPSH